MITAHSVANSSGVIDPEPRTRSVRSARMAQAPGVVDRDHPVGA
jgi:hypothetical protein